MRISKISATGRPVDLSYPTNRAIVFLALAAAAGGLLYRLFFHESLFRSGMWGLKAGLSVFLAWALCRELDPDNNLSAFVGAGLTSIGIFLWGFPSFLALFWLLVMIRILNRTTGLPAKMMDSFAVILLGCVLVFQGHWAFGLGTVLVFVLDGLLPAPFKRQLFYAGLAALSTIMIVLLKPGYWKAWELHWPLGGIVLGMSVLFIPVMFQSRVIKSTGDVTGEPLKSVRVIVGQGLALFTGIEVALWNGADGLQFLLPLWGAVVGAAIYRQMKPIQRIKSF